MSWMDGMIYEDLRMDGAPFALSCRADSSSMGMGRYQWWIFFMCGFG